MDEQEKVPARASKLVRALRGSGIPPRGNTMLGGIHHAQRDAGLGNSDGHVVREGGGAAVLEIAAIRLKGRERDGRFVGEDQEGGVVFVGWIRRHGNIGRNGLLWRRAQSTHRAVCAGGRGNKDRGGRERR